MTFPSQSVSKKALIAGWIVTALPVLFLIMDLGFKFISPPPEVVIKASAELGWPVSLNVPLGIILLICLLLYVIPPTAVLGAILLTGYLGGAIAVHVRVSDPLLSHTLFPIYVAFPIWLGLLLREPRLRVLIPLRRG